MLGQHFTGSVVNGSWRPANWRDDSDTSGVARSLVVEGFTVVEELSKFYEVLESKADGIVLLRRSSAPFEDDAHIHRETESLKVALDRVGRQGRALLVDAREAPFDTDARLTESFRVQRAEARRGFRAVAVLVKTQVGRLQANRLGMEPGSRDRVFDDAEAALAYLRSELGR